MPSHPACHLTYLPGSDRAAQPTAVWVCEYPYRTLRLSGPTRDCDDCPVWRELQRVRLEAAATDALTNTRDLEWFAARP